MALPVLTSWWGCGVAHEIFHLAAASAVGKSSDALTLVNAKTALFQRHVTVAECTVLEEKVIRHAGWAASVVLALALYANDATSSSSLTTGAAVVALEAICSDLMGFDAVVPSGRALKGVFNCGNFGLILLQPENKQYVTGILHKMVQVTMMRGAQCGGVVTYVKGGGNSLKGVRSRVLNGKRTNLADLIAAEMTANERFPKLMGNMLDGPRLYAGHTRFATTSKVTPDGTHPHQWVPPKMLDVYTGNWTSPSGLKKERLNFEVFICHNGDFDGLIIDGTTFELGTIQNWLPRATGAPAPSGVDSICIAGIVDLFRCQGSWFHAVRLAFLMGGGVDHGTTGLDYEVPAMSEFVTLGKVVASVFDEQLRQAPKRGSAQSLKHKVNRRASLNVMNQDKLVTAGMEDLRKRLPALIAGRKEVESCLRRWQPDVKNVGNEKKMAFARAAVNNFFDNDLLYTTRRILSNAVGSFGLCINCSLDSTRQVAFAARGQTISIAFYPRMGIVTYGSEAAATKAPLTIVPAGHKERLIAFFREHDPTKVETVDRTLQLFKGNERDMWNLLRDKYPRAFKTGGSSKVHPDEEEGNSPMDMMGIRIDLDDLGGEVCLLDWGEIDKQGPPSCSTESLGLAREQIMGGKATVTLCQEAFHKFGDLASRAVHIEEDERVLSLPPTVKYDPVGDDINGIPRACYKIQRDWDSGASPNRITAWYFGRELNARMIANESVLTAKAHRVDLLVTGCEVSLWIAEQFAADLSLVFPNLVIRAMSSNKILGLLGQNRPMQATGFQFSEDGWDLSDCVVLIVSHSGGTFAPLAVSNLMQSETNSIYVVTSEWDTQIGKQLRLIGKKNNVSSLMKQRIFSTDIGMHPAEACSISPVATHQLLTQLLIYLMDSAEHRGTKEDPHAGMHRMGATFLKDDVAQLEACNQNTIGSLEQIVGVDRDGITKNKSALSCELRAKGSHWANHVLEAPRTWVLCAVYILGTVIFGCPVFKMVVTGLEALDLVAEDTNYDTWVTVLDALFYLFCGQIFMTLIRLAQGRKVGHRQAGRSVVIGDVPWVAQVTEAFASKLFACSYSNTGVAFYSGNPADHLVHKFTHRVVRGGLLAVGRPDGRLAALASTEASVCLSVNQASSIQNLGVTLESLTIGHNPSKLPLSAHAVFLPPGRPDYLGEREVKRYDLEYNGAGKSAAALLGDFENLWKRSEEDAEKKARKAEQMRQASKGTVDGFSAQDVAAHLHHRGETKVERHKTIKSGPSELFAAKRLGDVQPSKEAYFGSALEKANPGVPVHDLIEMQSLSERLYENRCGSLHRLVSFMVLFHQMGKDVMDFWTKNTFGILGYEMDRTHSIMRIATTASPVSGAALRLRMVELEEELRWKHAQGVVRRMVRERLYGRRDVLGFDGKGDLTEEEKAAQEEKEAAEARIKELQATMLAAQNQIAKAIADAQKADNKAQEEARLAKQRAREDYLNKRVVQKKAERDSARTAPSGSGAPQQPQPQKKLSRGSSFAGLGFGGGEVVMPGMQQAGRPAGPSDPPPTASFGASPSKVDSMGKLPDIRAQRNTRDVSDAPSASSDGSSNEGLIL